MRNLNELGIRPWNKRPFPQFSVEARRDFEAMFGIMLPNDYLQLLHFANGGVLDFCEYHDPVTHGIGGINDFYGLGSREMDEVAATSGKWDYGNLWGETRIFTERMFKGPGIPIARDGGDNQLFLDYRDGDPCVSRFIFATRLPYRLARSFEEFIDMLHAKTPVSGSNTAVRQKRNARFGRLGD